MFRRAIRARLVLVTGVSLTVAVAAMVVFDRYRGILGDRDQSRLRDIGRGIAQYNQDFGGAFPVTLIELIRIERLNPNLAYCDAGLPIFGRPTTFVYLGQNLTADTVNGQTVVAYAPLSDNKGAGTDVLFGDGHTDWAAAGNLPIVLARGGPTSRPTTGSTR